MDKLGSRKLWVAIITIIGVLIGQEFDAEVSGEVLASAIAIAYIIGQAVVDAAKNKAAE